MAIKKKKIHYQRLSKYITSRECKSAQDYLLELYDRLSPENRKAIKDMLNRKSEDLEILEKYKKIFIVECKKRLPNMKTYDEYKI